jgi:DNA (cytosine-5)-methyltransferase 1
MQPILSFTKAKRAQNVNDYESWNEGGVAPTLNAMDNNGEAFATVLIVGVDIYNAEISENAFQTIKAGGGITSMPSVLIIDGTRVNDVRVYEDGIMPTVISRYGTGGGNVPMIFPSDDARELEKHQNGTGIGADGAPAYTLDRQQAPGVAVAFSPSDFANYSEGVGTLKAGMTNNNSPVIAFDAYNHTTSETNQTLRTGSDLDKMGTVLTSSVVRRLTPVECERLQGFPDNWTDGQADSNRYKQMGNAVAVPVVEWIISRMVAE